MPFSNGGRFLRVNFAQRVAKIYGLVSSKQSSRNGKPLFRERILHYYYVSNNKVDVYYLEILGCVAAIL